ncbi:hypothetical protein [Vitiosangium sp. GDMCC 1.1324]|uniref:hypothetical protein n=1 Tax=Vitiosangium sp. (strain GDMCC 1.1324) TaxID=2138576 RepID=UPI000D3450FC|nr:hypothetical protein [Vitiosangium sp. GDMCC 1.1324]PTL79247.1 hypothetical protein DAT35_34125 [Vitiosangium sp. GDMCC 1.1324]
MRATSFVISLSLAAALGGCSSVESQSTPIQGSDLYSELPSRRSTVSGIVYDPEAFFFTVATWPAPPPGEEPSPDDEAPPPALMVGIPYLMRSSPLVAQMSVTQGSSEVSSGASAPNGFWELGGLSTGETVYQVKSTPPQGGIELWNEPEFFPPEVFPPVPPAKYYSTTTLRPIVPRVGSCPLQMATVVGEAGALGAVANLLTSMGTATTPADLVDPTKTGGVALIWLYAPSPVLDVFDSPSGGISAEASQGTLYPIGWAPDAHEGDPEPPPPGRSPMGYFALPPGEISPLGYYALVLPKGATGQVAVSFHDTVTSAPGEEPGPGGPRPWSTPGFSFDATPGVSFARLHAMPEAGPEDPLAEHVPEPDTSWQCLP